MAVAAVAAVVVLVAAAVAALMVAVAGERLWHPNFESAARAVAEWNSCSRVSPWELSKLDDTDLFNPPAKAIVPNRLWPNKTVPFIIEKTQFAKGEANKIRDVIERANKLSCVQFWEADHVVEDYVRITGKFEGCYTSYLGRKGGEQFINLQSGKCTEPGTIFHELFHVLGFRHMHNAPNRDSYIRVISENIGKGDEKHFTAYARNKNYTDLGIRYDYDSLMHFSRRAHSANGKDTIDTHDLGAVIGRKLQPSTMDVGKLNILYEC